MRYVIQNKIISFGGSSTVRDEFENDLYKVKGRFLSFTRFKTICTMDGEPLYKVRNKFISLFLPKVYVMDAEGNRLLTIKKKSFFSFRQDFEIVPEPGMDYDLEIQGDILAWDFDVYNHGERVAYIRRNFSLLRDSFSLEVDDDADAPFYIALVIALDNYYDKLRDDRN